jgi:eukaryotic-like serine/threonine-protein kinase
VYVGTIISEKYRLEAIIGEGSMGVVWRATQLGLDRPVAIKVMHAGFAHRPDARARFTREARVAAALRHPAAIAVLDFGEADDEDRSLYLVMELLIGQPLRALLEARAVPLAEAAAITVEVARALAAAHDIQLVHRDIKPENIFLEAHPPGYRVKVVDFGLAFIAAPPDEDAGVLGRMTEEGVLGGTPLYMSPEQTRGVAVGPPTDIYALGCVFYELVAGRPPFLGSVAEILTRHAYAAPVPLRKLAPDVALPTAVDELVSAMIAKPPEVRPSPARVIEVLGPLAAGRAVAERSGTGASRAERMVPPTSPPPVDGAAAPSDGVPIAWIGPIEDGLLLGLAASGFAPIVGAPAADALVVYAPGATIDELAALARAHRVVITDVAAGDLDGVTARLRAGVAEVVSRPVRADDLVRKLRRAARPR